LPPPPRLGEIKQLEHTANHGHAGNCPVDRAGSAATVQRREDGTGRTSVCAETGEGHRRRRPQQRAPLASALRLHPRGGVLPNSATVSRRAGPRPGRRPSSAGWPGHGCAPHGPCSPAPPARLVGAHDRVGVPTQHRARRRAGLAPRGARTRGRGVVPGSDLGDGTPAASPTDPRRARRSVPAWVASAATPSTLRCHLPVVSRAASPRVRSACRRPTTCGDPRAWPRPARRPSAPARPLALVPRSVTCGLRRRRPRGVGRDDGLEDEHGEQQRHDGREQRDLELLAGSLPFCSRPRPSLPPGAAPSWRAAPTGRVLGRHPTFACAAARVSRATTGGGPTRPLLRGSVEDAPEPRRSASPDRCARRSRPITPTRRSARRAAATAGRRAIASPPPAPPPGAARPRPRP
jgi:hypothetical protein